jgi:hypothetical protein
MAKSQQTFRKRQRERMLREKAQQKRARREQRRQEKKPFQDDLTAPVTEATPADSEAHEQRGIESLNR